MSREDCEVLKSLIVLSVPTIIEQILSTLLQYVDTAMVGRLGESATASVSVTTTVTWLVNGFPQAIGVGVLAMIAKAVGSGDKKQVERISGQALLLAVLCGVIVGGISMLLAPFIPVWMGADASIQKTASRYFFIISLPMLFRSANIILGAAIRATKDTKTPMIISFGANLLNVILNYILIYWMGFGVVGAAMASALSFTFSGVLMFVAYLRNDYLHIHWRDLTLDAAILRECGALSIPVLGTNVTSCLGYVVFASLVTGMGNTIFAAHSIAVTAETLFYIPGYGLRTATSALVGISRGEGDAGKFETISRLSVILTVGMMCISGLVLYFAAHPLMELFTNSGEVADLGAAMLKLVAFSEPFFGLMIVLEGIFYGLGHTRYAFLVETGGMWCIRILCTFLCVRVFGLSLTAVWYCMIADNVCKALLFTLPVLTKKKRETLFFTA